MLLVRPETISQIDKYASEKMNISPIELMRRSAEAICERVRAMLSAGGNILILSGGGNNGGDGYAAASMLATEYKVSIIDVFGIGQRTDEGKYYLDKCKMAEIPITVYKNNDEIALLFERAELIIDAVLGVGARLPLGERLKDICRLISASSALKLAVDVPLGVDAGTGEIASCAPTYDETVSLCYVKLGLTSYPAASVVGRITNFDLSLHAADVKKIAESGCRLVDLEEAAKLLPQREANSSKGSFGKAFIIAGSEMYPGAAQLAVGAALRGGAGYVTYVGEKANLEQIGIAYPETLLKERPSFEKLTRYDINSILNAVQHASSVLLGSGAGCSDGLYELVLSLMESEGSPLILDADAINVMAKNRIDAYSALKNSKRRVILTPHPLEFARLTGKSIDKVQGSRLPLAIDFAKETGTVLILKGAATIVTDGSLVFVNSSGSSALAKAGSGDALAGIIASLVASSNKPIAQLCALAVYVHGAAANTLEQRLSSFGVTPSDLPAAMAEELRRCERIKEKTQHK